MDAVPRQEYEYALSNFRIAHLKVAEQKTQLDEQERQISLLRARIALLEGGDDEPKHTTNRAGGSSVDDFSIRNTASQLERLINRWAAEVTNTSQMPLDQMRELIFGDLGQGPAQASPNATPVQVQNLLRHLMSDTICEGLVNCLVVTSSNEANIQLTRIHEHIFARDSTVASVWRRQTYSAAVETCTPEMMSHVLLEHAPGLIGSIAPGGKTPPDSLMAILNGAYSFSKMLHGSKASSGGGADAFYKAFVPEIGSILYPRQIELVKRCVMNERGQVDRVGACVFPGLVKVSRGTATPDQGEPETTQTVVRRAQVICGCALGFTH
ncbi:hypothetical protein RSOLAG1IB_01188 [Rhizoctonia solani AG-1 IB]|uniref:Uncharacterized protein n=1 Tax=Thanatephorus cucumeris (strain AG1-IB / isolate 7/3/14) TaxID=1108050 RepID=A0A0B7FCA1_THACB|nr:hypothetical protein RSOLAG1IB_01188 [Rhizoctonia solani AG-1 IB]